MASASMMKSTLQRILNEKRDHYKQGKEHFDIISEQLKTLNDNDDDEQKQKLLTEQANLKGDLDTQGGEISAIESILRKADDEATADTSTAVDENSARNQASTDKDIHPSRQVLKPFKVHKIVAVFEKTTVTEEERIEMLELLNRVWSVYCELTSDLTSSTSPHNLMDMYSKLPENRQQWESLEMTHPWLMLKERGVTMTLDQQKTLLYGASEFGTLPRHFEQQGKQIPNSMVANDLNIVMGWTRIAESIGRSNTEDDKLHKEPTQKSNLAQAVVDMRKSSQVLQTRTMDPSEFQSLLLPQLSRQSDGTNLQSGKMGLTQPVVATIDAYALKGLEDTGYTTSSPMSNSLNKTSLGARTSRSSQQHQNASHEDSFSTLVLPGEEDRRAEIQQLAHDQYRTPLEIDPQEELCFYKTRTSNPIPSSVRTWALLQQHDFVTALAMGHLPFDSLTYTELYWYVQLMDAVFFCFVEFIKLAQLEVHI